MKRIYKFIGTIFLVFTSLIVFCQIKYKTPNTKEIIINCQDSVIKAEVLLVNKDMQFDNSLFYYWYNSDKIYKNKGGYFGKLLHGKYVICNSKEQLLVEGYFNKGIKNGTWKRWYTNGQLKSMEIWKNGTRSGNSQYYNNNGKIIKSIDFKKDKIHGNLIEYINDSSLTYNYKDGEIVKKNNLLEKNNTKKDNKFWNKLFKKKTSEDKKIKEKTEPNIKTSKNIKNPASQKKALPKNKDNNKKDAENKENNKTDNLNFFNKLFKKKQK